MIELKTDAIRNVAIVGHGGSGKTMLVEHMLYTSGATDRLGTVESGTTQSDFDVLETKRHISLSAAVTPLFWHGCKINVIDVPGFQDFVGDLYAVARVVESMIIVCEAKRDLDVGFERAFDIAQEHGLATCIFVNKLERENADYPGLMETLHARYGRRIVSTEIPIGHQTAFSGVLDLLNMKVYKGRDRGQEIEEVPSGYTLEAAERREKMMDATAEGDDGLASKYLEGQELTQSEIEHGLLMGVENGRVIPVLLGSAATGIGVATLLDRICGELPSPIDFERRTLKPGLGEHRPKPDVAGSLSALCFKTTADPFVGKINYVRVFSGTLHADESVITSDSGATERIHNLFWPHGKAQEPVKEVIAGDICAVAKLASLQTGGTIRLSETLDRIMPIEFPEPIYRVAICPVSKADEDKLGPALARLLEEDPTLRYSRDAASHQETLEGMGDVHIEMVIEKLKAKFGVTVVTEEARVPYRETVRSSSRAQGRHKRQTGGKGQFGDCWIELEPLSRGAGFQFESKVVGGAIPKNYIPAIEKGIREEMDHGFQAGYPAVDFKVTVVDGSYHEVDSNEQAFKTAGALALRQAALQAEPVILEPMMKLEITVPDECVGDVIGDLNGRRGRLLGMDSIGVGKTEVWATVPMALTTRYALDLRSMTKGRGLFRQHLSHYDEMPFVEAQKIAREHSAARGGAEVERV